MIVTSTGFSNTGSSAITHILSEFSLVQNSGKTTEFRLLYDADCICDLEYNLITNPHRHNTSNAIKRFKKFVDFNTNPLLNHHYEKIFNNQFKKLSYEYINDICDLIYKGMYFGDVYNRGKLFWFVNRCYQKVITYVCKFRKLLSILPLNIVPKNELCYAGTFSEKKFLQATKKYIKNLLEVANGKNVKYTLIDQFFPPSNVDHYFRFIPDDEECKVFIVQRDPRDLYCIAKCFLNNRIIPTESAEVFCDWFLWTRGQAVKSKDKDRVMYIQFEDLVYKYEQTRKKICKFVGIDINSECKQKSNFDPLKSINNTQTFIRFKDKVDSKEIEYIEKKLGKYCYNFPKDGVQPDFSKLNMYNT